MNAPPALLVFIRGPDAGAHVENTAAMGWCVIATLCCLFFLLGCFATAAWQIWRRTTRPDAHVRLLIELADADEETIIQSADEKPDGPEPRRNPWEKPPDWWKPS